MGVALSPETVGQHLELSAVAKTGVFQRDHDALYGDTDHEKPLVISNPTPEGRRRPFLDFGIESGARTYVEFPALLPRNDREVSDFCLMIDYDPFAEFQLYRALWGSTDAGTHFSGVGRHDVESAMTVDSGELVEPPECRGVRLRVPVRLHEFDDLAVVLREWPQPALIVPIQRLGEVTRKLQLSVTRRRVLPRLDKWRRRTRHSPERTEDCIATHL